MKTNQEGINVIKHFESLHDGDLKQLGLQPKMCPAGIWTEGYGHAIRDLRGQFFKGNENKLKAYANSIVKNEKQAEQLLTKDLESFELIVMRKLKRELEQNEFDALVSFVFNCGVSQTLFEMVNSQNPLLKSWWETHYITGNGQILNGLVKRRKLEAKLYFTK